MEYTEEELKQIFQNRSNCYADSDEVIMAMDSDRFIEVLTELGILPKKSIKIEKNGLYGTTNNKQNIQLF